MYKFKQVLNGFACIKHKYITMEAQQMASSHKSIQAIQALNDKNKNKQKKNF